MLLLALPLLAAASADFAVAKSWPNEGSRDVFSRRYRGADEVRDDHSGSGGGGSGSGHSGSDHSGSSGSHDSGSGNSGKGSGGQSNSGSGSAIGDEDDRFGKK